MKQSPLEVAPFRALRYDLETTKALIADLVCPPYDVIDASAHEKLLQRSPYNAVNVILPALERHDDYKKGIYPYDREAERLGSWLEKGVLKRDAKPALYVYHQTFADPVHAGQTVTRKGVVALKRLAEFGQGNVRPHEKTLPGPKQDRLNLLRKVRTNMSPIFGLYSDAESAVDTALEKAIANHPPLYELTTHEPEAIVHRLWAVTDGNTIRQVCEKLSGTLFIADGHHRYETALNYRRELESATPGLPQNGGHHYLPIYLANLHDPGLLILPTHRLVHGLLSLDSRAFLESLAGDFDVTPIENFTPSAEFVSKSLPLDGPVAFLLAGSKRLFGPQRFWKLTLKAAKLPREPLAALDVSILQERIFFARLGFKPADVDEQKHVTYTRSAAEAVQWVDEHKIQMAFYTRPPTAAQVSQICEAGQRMPQKSTFFFPKVATGLVFRPVDPHEDIHL